MCFILAPKTDQPTTTTLPSLPFAFGTTAAVTKPSEEPTKSAFAFIPTGTATGISKFGKTTGGDVLKFGETSTLALATTTASSAPAAVPATVPAAGFQFGSAFGASDKSASTTTSLSTPQLNFSAPTAQSNPLSDTSKNTGLSSAPFVFKGVGDGSKSLGSGFVFSGTGDGNKSGGNSTTPSTGFAFGGAGSTSTSGFGFGSGATNTSKPSSDTTLAPFVFGGQGGAPKTGFGFGASNQVRICVSYFVGLIFVFCSVFAAVNNYICCCCFASLFLLKCILCSRINQADKDVLLLFY